MPSITIIGYVIIGVFLSILYYLRDTSLLLYAVGEKCGRTSFKYKYELLAFMIIFGAGIVFVDFQELFMDIADIFYDCGAFPVVQIIVRYILMFFRWTYYEIIVRWNDLWLYWRDCIASMIHELKNVHGNGWDIAQEVIQAITDAFLCLLRAIYKVPSWSIPFLTDLAKAIINVPINFYNSISKQLQHMVTATYFSEDCKYCEIYHDDYVSNGNTCEFMEMTLSAYPVNCSNCDGFIKDMGMLAGDFVDELLLAFGSNHTTYIHDVFDDIVCILELWKRPAFVVLSVLDTEFTGSTCYDDNTIVDTLETWAVEIFTCFDHLLNDLSNGKLNSFFDWLFEKILPAFHEVVQGVKEMRDCFDSDAQMQCVQTYPDNCSWSGGTSITTNGGLQTCATMLNHCLSNITFLQPLMHIGAHDYNLFSIGVGVTRVIDDIVCTVDGTIICFEHGANVHSTSNSGLTNVLNSLECVKTDVKPFAKFAGFLIDALSWINDLAEGAKRAFECFGGQCVADGFTPLFTGTGTSTGCDIGDALECMVDCFDNPNSCDSKPAKRKRNEFDDLLYSTPMNYTFAYEMARKKWVDVLTYKEVDKETVCGKILSSKSPVEVLLGNNTDWGEYNMYTSCLSSMITHVTSNSGNPFASYAAPLISMRLHFNSNIIQRKRDLMIEKKKRVGDYSLPGYFRSRFNDAYTDTPNKSKGLLSKLWDSFTTSRLYNLTMEFIGNVTHTESAFVTRGFYSNDTFSQCIEIEDTCNDHRRHINGVRLNRGEFEGAYNIYTTRFVDAFEAIKSEYSLKKKSSFGKSVSEHFREKREKRAMKWFESRSNMDYYEYEQLLQEEETNEHYKLRANRAWNTLIELGGIKHWERFENLHSIYYVMSNPHPDNIIAYMNEDNRYTVDYGFVHKDDYHQLKEYRRSRSYTPIISEAKTHYRWNNTNRFPPRKFGPFLIDFNYTNVFPPLANISDYLHGRVLAREQAEKMRKSTSKLQEDFNFNEYFINATDSVVSYFANEKSLFKKKLQRFKDKFSSDNIKRYLLYDVGSGFTRFVEFEIPTNIDGSAVYNFWSLPLLPEYLFDWVELLPTWLFPVQIQWPRQLITANCTNTYNGVKNFTHFHLSNNCYNSSHLKTPQTDGQERPFCEWGCDYCKREYSRCKDIGFLDGFDSIMFALGAFPALLDGFYNKGPPVLLIQQLTMCSTFFVGLALGGIFAGLGIIGAELVGFWILESLFGHVPWGLIIAVIVIVIAYIAPSSLSNFPLFYVATGIIVLTWIISLFTAFTFTGYTPIITVLNIVEFLNDSALFFYLPDLTPLVIRINRFNYENLEVPNLDIFCYFWTFSNIGFAFVAVYFSRYILELLIRWSIISLLFLFELGNIIIRLDTSLTIQRLNNLTAGLREAVSKIKKNYNELMQMYQEQKQDLMQQVNMWRRQRQPARAQNFIEYPVPIDIDVRHRRQNEDQ